MQQVSALGSLPSKSTPSILRIYGRKWDRIKPSLKLIMNSRKLKIELRLNDVQSRPLPPRAVQRVAARLHSNESSVRD